MPANIVNFVAGNGINIVANETLDTLTINATESLSNDQKAALQNDKANDGNKFITNDELMTLLGQHVSTPDGYPKFITDSGTVVIPRTGYYRIRAVGGGGGGGGGDVGDGTDGTPTIVKIIGGSTYTANGGHAGKTQGSVAGQQSPTPTVPNPRYDTLKGATRGGNNNMQAEDGAGLGGGLAGGGGTPLNYQTDAQVAQHGANMPTVGYNSFGTQGGKGYGAGGGGGGSNFGAPSGGSSGYLITETLQLDANTNIQITIGSGGLGGTGGFEPDGVQTGGLHGYNGGNGAQGAVLIEWIDDI